MESLLTSCFQHSSPLPLKFSFHQQSRKMAIITTLHRSLSCTPCCAMQQQLQSSITTSSSSKRKEKLTTKKTHNPETDTDSLPPKKKVLGPIGFGTEEMEAVILVDVLRRAGANVLVASVEPQLQIESSSGTRLIADACICSNQIFDLVALPGGVPGFCEVTRL